MQKASIFIGYDPRPQEVQAYAVARTSFRRRMNIPIPIKPLILDDLRDQGLYYRETEVRNGRLWDTISEAPMSTEFAISRFLTPHIAREGYALFVDGDVMAVCNIAKIFNEINPSKAVSVVKHVHKPSKTSKMDNQIQTSYARKNWSSVMLWNCEHPKVKALTPSVVNSERGLWLHQFSWLDEDDIGELSPKWNYLVGATDKSVQPAIVHFTDGIPSMPGYENCEYAEEWRKELKIWAR
jgi:lipopolysaccharide biosynthesis glycosyltransferase